MLPRQTCGLYTKNLLYREYPGGPSALERLIHGGELFQTILFNRINVFMTHMPNYVLDRLAPYTFESVLSKLRCWTNLDLRSREPTILADIYFKMFPDELEPIWGVSMSACDTGVVYHSNVLQFRTLAMIIATSTFGQIQRRAAACLIFSLSDHRRLALQHFTLSSRCIQLY